MIKKLGFLICLTILTSSCSVYRVNSRETTDNIYLPKPSQNEVAYIEKITQPHDVIGFVTVTADRSHRRMESIIERMKREAAILGGDAITEIKMESTGLWKKIPARKIFGNAYIRLNFTAKVVAFQ